MITYFMMDKTTSLPHYLVEECLQFNNLMLDWQYLAPFKAVHRQSGKISEID